MNPLLLLTDKSFSNKTVDSKKTVRDASKFKRNIKMIFQELQNNTEDELYIISTSLLVKIVNILFEDIYFNKTRKLKERVSDLLLFLITTIAR